jgi:hypothetical protein
MKTITATSVICLWEYKDDHWSLAMSCAADSDRCVISREPLNWVSSRPIGESFDKMIDGRAITTACLRDGVRLRIFNPPSKVTWISNFNGFMFSGSPGWQYIINGGLEMYRTTLAEAYRILFGIEQDNIPVG